MRGPSFNGPFEQRVGTWTRPRRGGPRHRDGGPGAAEAGRAAPVLAALPDAVNLTGNLTLPSANTFSGGLTVSNGTALLGNNSAAGIGTISVSYSNQTSTTAPIQVVSAAFGTFTPSARGSGQASVTDTNYNLNTIVHTLHPGDVGILWGTGLGPITSSDAAAPPVGNVGSPTVYVGNTAVTPSYAGRSGCCSGLDQIVFTVPQGVQGCYVPIAVQAGGAVGNIGTIAVSAAGQNTCSDSVMGQDLVNKLAAGGNVDFGYLRLESINLVISGLAGSGRGNGDTAYATFSKFTPTTAYYAEYGVSSGYCVSSAYYVPADMSVAQLDAGSALSVSGPLVAPGPMTPNQTGSGYYSLNLTQNVSKYMYSDINYTVAGLLEKMLAETLTQQLCNVFGINACFSGVRKHHRLRAVVSVHKKFFSLQPMVFQVN